MKSVPRRLAYITSMATGGLAGFNYKELVELQSLGVDVSLFITKYKAGPYMPSPSMPLHRVEPARIAGRQLAHLLADPIKYFRLFCEAVRTKTVQDFAIAQVWAHNMRASTRD